MLQSVEKSLSQNVLVTEFADAMVQHNKCADATLRAQRTQGLMENVRELAADHQAKTIEKLGQAAFEAKKRQTNAKMERSNKLDDVTLDDYLMMDDHYYQEIKQTLHLRIRTFVHEIVTWDCQVSLDEEVYVPVQHRMGSVTIVADERKHVQSLPHDTGYLENAQEGLRNAGARLSSESGLQNPGPTLLQQCPVLKQESKDLAELAEPEPSLRRSKSMPQESMTQRQVFAAMTTSMPQEMTATRARLQAKLIEKLVGSSVTYRMPSKERATAGKRFTIFVGNPGTGKSSMANAIAGELVFASGTTFGVGLTKVLKTHDLGNRVLVDVPGLDDVSLRKIAADEIHRALCSGGMFEICFVITTENGRVRPNDMRVIQCILEAVGDQVKEGQYSILVNQCPERWMGKLRNSADAMSEFVSVLHQSLCKHGAPITDHICFVSRIDDLDGADSALLTPDEILAEFQENLPCVNIEHSLVKTLDLENWDKRVEDLTTELQQLHEAMRNCDGLLGAFIEKHQKVLYWANFTNFSKFYAEICSLMLTDHSGTGQEPGSGQKPKTARKPHRIRAWTVPRSDTCVRMPSWSKAVEYGDQWRRSVAVQILAEDGEPLLTLSDPKLGNSALKDNPQEGCVLRILHADGTFEEFRMYTNEHVNKNSFGSQHSNAEALLVQMLAHPEWFPFNNPLCGLDMASIVPKMTNSQLSAPAFKIEVSPEYDLAVHYGVYVGVVESFRIYDREGNIMYPEGSCQDAKWIYSIDVNGCMSWPGKQDQ